MLVNPTGYGLLAMFRQAQDEQKQMAQDKSLLRFPITWITRPVQGAAISTARVICTSSNHIPFLQRALNRSRALV
jgi:hypothetical protein